LQKAYAELIDLTGTSWAQAHQVSRALRQQKQEQAQRVQESLWQLLPLVEQVIHQATRRLFHREAVPASAKLVSLFEPHTQILRRGKAPPRDTEFGHKVNYAEVEHGFISDWQLIAKGNPPDAQLLPALLRNHHKRFGHGPCLLAGDQGLFSPANEQLAGRLGVKQICLPQPGAKTKQRRLHEQQAWFKRGQRFRNGIEGRISVVRRTVQLARCPYHGLDGFERWIGWGVLVANLVVMARLQTPRRRRSKPC
jgi:IS5 family transposase